MNIFMIAETEEDVLSQSLDKNIELVPVNFRQNINQALGECIKTSINLQLEYSVICLNKQLLSSLSESWLIENLEKCFKLRCKILLFNADKIKTLVPISESFFWLDFFMNTSLFAIHKSIYENLLIEIQKNKCPFTEILSNVTSNKLLIHPLLLAEQVTPEHFYLLHRMNRMMDKFKLLQED